MLKLKKVKAVGIAMATALLGGALYFAAAPDAGAAEQAAIAKTAATLPENCTATGNTYVCTSPVPGSQTERDLKAAADPPGGQQGPVQYCDPIGTCYNIDSTRFISNTDFRQEYGLLHDWGVENIGAFDIHVDGSLNGHQEKQQIVVTWVRGPSIVELDMTSRCLKNLDRKTFCDTGGYMGIHDVMKDIRLSSIQGENHSYSTGFLTPGKVGARGNFSTEIDGSFKAEGRGELFQMQDSRFTPIFYCTNAQVRCFYRIG